MEATSESQFLDGSFILREHPTPAFKRFVRGGYRLQYYEEFSRPHDDDDLYVRVLSRDRIVATALFRYEFDGGLYCFQVLVAKRHRRKSIATAMYGFAEKFLGLTLNDRWRDEDLDTLIRRIEILSKAGNERILNVPSPTSTPAANVCGPVVVAFGVS